ncbi:MAG TPA: hypothetical protein VIT92_15650 [Burkholderiaceae bacterium]
MAMRPGRNALALTMLCALAIPVTMQRTHAAASAFDFATIAAVETDTPLAGALAQHDALPYDDVEDGARFAFFSAQAGEKHATVDDRALDDVRGGFDFGNGLIMSLGVERLVSINGSVISSQSFNIADVTKLSQEQAKGAFDAINGLTLIQNGAGNHFSANDVPNTFAGTVIQNTLSNQDLKTQTIINTSVNSAELLKGMNFQTNLRDALAIPFNASK